MSAAALRLAALLTMIVLPSTTINGAITVEQREHFQHKGYLYVPNFFSSSAEDAVLLQNLLKGGDSWLQHAPPAATSRTFSICEPGVLFGIKDELCNVEADGNYETVRSDFQDIVHGFRNVALRSSLVDTVAELMQLDPHSQIVRVLR